MHFVSLVGEDRMRAPMIRRKSKARYRLVAAFLLAMAVSNGIEFWQQRARMAAGYGDFSALYTSGVMLRQGKGRLLYDRQEQWKSQQEFAANVDIRKGPMPFIRPPFEALLFLPLTYFSYPVALAVWSLAKVILLWLTARTLPRPAPFTRIYPAWLEVALCLGLFPVFLDLFQGQDAILLLSIVAIALHRLQSGKDVAAGFLLALGLFKFHLVVPIAIMLWLAGRARILMGFLPAAVALVALSCLISGAGVLSVYPVYLLNLNRTSGVGVVTAQSMPNLRGLLTAFLGRSPYPGPIHWLLLPAALAAIALTVWLWRRLMITGFAGLASGYCLALLVAILTSYYAYSYDMTLLIIPLLLLGGGFLDCQASDQPGLPTHPRRMIAAGLLLLICTPLYWVLILGLDCPYLLVVPMFVLALGIATSMRQALPEAV
jgi:Glycosyltransferase family 87